jgi:hypothetical protein
MLNAIAKMTTDAVGAVADTVENVLPLPGKNDDRSEPADADTARDQDTSKASKADNKSGKEQSEGPVSRPLDGAPTVSGDLDLTTLEATGKDREQDAGPTFETTEKKTTSKSKQKVVTHTDDVEIPPAAQQTPVAKSSKDTTSAAHADGATSSPLCLTAGGRPLPKVSKGKAKWMKSSTAWYPDRAGVMHAPGVYINRKPRSNYMNPTSKIEVVF